MKENFVSIVILSYNQLEYTQKCLESLRRYTGDVEHEVIVVDNASTDERTVSYLEAQKDLRLIRNRENLGFAGGCNQGMQAALGEYILLLNNDVIVTRYWLKNMLELLKSDESVGMVGPLTNSTVGKQKIDVPYGEDLDAMQSFAAGIAGSGAPPWLTLRLVGFCVLFRKRLTDEIGLLDTGFEVGNYEDDDFNIRALLSGKKSYICRTSFVHHFMGVSFRAADLQKEKIMMKNKLFLEKKWDRMDWNHHAVFNKDMLESIVRHGGKKILHLGCGLGALEIELKDRDPGYYLAGVEEHSVRRTIAAAYMDELLPWDGEFQYLRELSVKKYDIMIAECVLEKAGMELLRKIRPFLSDSGILILRVFNARHITTVERIVTGEVGGDLICASSGRFCRYFGPELEELLEREAGYRVLRVKEIRKTLSHIQDQLYRALEEYPEYRAEAGIYNRIYWLEKEKAWEG